MCHDQRRRRQGCCPAPSRSLRHFVDAQQNDRATKQRPEGREDEQPQENLVLGSRSGEEECVAASGVIAATHSVCLSHEGRSFAGLSTVNQRWATLWPCAPPRASGALLLAHHEHGAVGVPDNRFRNTTHQRPPYGAQTSAAYHDRPCP